DVSGDWSSDVCSSDLEACQTGDEQAFRAAVELITAKALQAGLAAIDFKAVVAEEWRRTGLDETLDKQVDLAVAEVHDESSWGDRSEERRGRRVWGRRR